MGRKREAWDALKYDLLNALVVNMEAHPEALSLLRPFFPHDWFAPSEDLTDYDLGLLASSAAYALNELSEFTLGLELDQVAIRILVAIKEWRPVDACLANVSTTFHDLNRLALSEHYSLLALRLAEALDSPDLVFASRLMRFARLAEAGRWDEAEEMWSLHDPMGRDWPLRIYRQGRAEQIRLEVLLFPRGRLTEGDLAAAERRARAGQNRKSIRLLRRLRGEWQLSRGEHARAAESLQDAIRMAHEAGFPDPGSETLLALARFRLKRLPNPREEVQRLSAGRDPAHLPLAELWHALTDTEQAARHAKAAYRHAWADGEPYVRRYALDRAKSLLQQLGEDIPALPAYDPAQHPKNPWEYGIEAAITKLKKRARSQS